MEAGERLGFLPGDLKDKLDPYLQPLYDALGDMIPVKKLQEFMTDGTIQIAPLAYMRGRTLDKACVILDEAQNTNLGQLKMFLTRMGTNAKFIVTGDASQVDLPKKEDSGLLRGISLLKDLNGVGTIFFTNEDIVRHPLVTKIVKAFDNAKMRNSEKSLHLQDDAQFRRHGRIYANLVTYMKRVLSAISKIWFPALVVGIVAVQSFASDFSRAMASRGAEASRDTVIYSNNIFTKFRSEYERAREDSMSFELMSGDSNEVVITARDTMKVPDSLRFTDPFRYKYYVAIKDSLTHVIVRDSLKNAGDSIDWPKLDSLYKIDSTETAIRKFNEWYASLDKAARKKYDFEQKMKARQVMIDSILNAKDSLLAIRDSIRENTPRILETFAVPDSLYYKRILTWNKGSYFNDVHLQKLDTSYNYRFNDYPFYREDVNVSYLGIVGSATQYYDFFKRKSAEGVTFYTPYECYSYNPYSLPFYNTKTPYTELAYWGTLFANEERAENNLHIMTTQNILPSWNFTLEYDRFGANGMLENERVDNRTFAASTNFTGKKYLAHAGYIYNKMDKGENGGIVDNFWIRDTTVGSREIDVRLKDASTLIKKNTVFLDQTYRIPFTFILKLQEKKVLKRNRCTGTA